MRLFSSLMPRGRRFFDLFDRHAELVVEGSVVLSELLRNHVDREERNRRVARIDALEHTADRATHETVSLLHKTCVTPIDRDDIQRLISSMDDVLDLIQDAVRPLSNMDRAARALRLCHEIDGFESEADRVMRVAISRLFRE